MPFFAVWLGGLTALPVPIFVHAFLSVGEAHAFLQIHKRASTGSPVGLGNSSSALKNCQTAGLPPRALELVVETDRAFHLEVIQ